MLFISDGFSHRPGVVGHWHLFCSESDRWSSTKWAVGFFATRQPNMFLLEKTSISLDHVWKMLHFFRNDVVPIVMGARPEDYARSAPQHSYIHVDDFDSPKDLADYLHALDKDDKLYNEYFNWKVLSNLLLSI